MERGSCDILGFLLALPVALSVNEEFLSGAPQHATDRHSPVLYVRRATLIMIAASRHGPDLLDLLLSSGTDPMPWTIGRVPQSTTSVKYPPSALHTTPTLLGV